MLNQGERIYFDFILATEVNGSGNEVFKKIKQGSEYIYCGINTEGQTFQITKKGILNNLYMCKNAATSDGQSLRVKHTNDAYIIRNFRVPTVKQAKTTLTSLETGSSFGSKAYALENTEIIRLYSFDAVYCEINKRRNTICFPSHSNGFTQTTLKHIRSFLAYAQVPSWVYSNLYSKQAKRIPLNVEMSMADFNAICNG